MSSCDFRIGMTSIYNSTTTTLLVNTTSTRKIVFLPVASTVGAGRLLWIKDISGNAAVSSIYISTIGMDRIENRFAPSTLFAVMSTSYGSVMMTTDGILNWYFLQHYYRNAISVGGQTSFVYFSNMIFKLTAFPSGTIYSDSGGTTLSTVSGGVSLWKDSNNVYNFGLGTAATYALVGSVNAVYFSGSSYLAGSSLALNNLSTYTLETVVYLTSVSITSYFIAKQDNGINSYNRFRSTNGTIQWNTHNGSSTISSGSTLSANQWYHIAVTYDGSIGSIYINGSLSSATSASLPILDDSSSTHGNTLGAWTGDGNTFNGNMYMAEFNAYSVCLTGANILSSYTSRKSKYGF